MPQQAKRSLSFWEILNQAITKLVHNRLCKVCRQKNPLKSIDTFRSSGDRTSDAESALARAALHAANANNQIGTAREQSLAESNAYREKNTIK
uniref:Uncharacterized protein n=1 Tax=Klebsiella pneumoniae TaxID=573 RepID=A0A8B0SV61_KLEPN|nr:hypothetical protein [Klebsiella pneumoniae]